MTRPLPRGGVFRAAGTLRLDHLSKIRFSPRHTSKLPKPYPTKHLSPLGRAFFLGTLITACAAPQSKPPQAAPIQESTPSDATDPAEELRETVKQIVKDAGFGDEEQAAAVAKLESMGPKIAPVLHELYYDRWVFTPDKRIVIAALSRLAEKDDALFALYTDALTSKDSGIQMAAIRALGEFGDTRASQHLLPRLEGFSFAMQEVTSPVEVAGITLAILPLVIGKIVATGDNTLSYRKYPDLSEGAAVAAAMIRLGPDTAPAIIDSLDHNASASAAKLVMLEGFNYAGLEMAQARQVLKDFNDEGRMGLTYFRFRVARELGESEAAVRVMLANLDLSGVHHGFTEVAEEDTVKILVKMGAIAVPHLIHLVESGPGHAPANAALALGQIRDERGFATLLAAMESRSFFLRMHAAEALGEWGDKRAESVLTKALKDKDEFVRQAAEEALQKLAKTESMQQ